MAEEALASYERDDRAETVFPPAAQRIRRAREALTLTHEDVATRWGEQVSMYWDLEFHDDEAFTVISVRQLQHLASVLETTVNVLLFGEEPTPPLPTVQHRDVVAGLDVCMAEDALSIDQLGDRIGWELRPLLADSGALGDLPVSGLWSVCRAANVDWVGVINTEQNSRG